MPVTASANMVNIDRAALPAAGADSTSPAHFALQQTGRPVQID
jgi:hypothetical protein